MALDGFGVGCVYAVNPLQITGGVPAAETGSAISFYQLVRTVAVAPTLDNVLVLGLIVVIRTFLSFSLETEIEGTFPWRHARAGSVEMIRRATATALDRETPP